MNLDSLKEWILLGTGFVSLVSVAVTSIWAIREFGLKQKAEARAAKKEEAETDVRLLKAFTELMDIANGRGGYEVSEKIIEEVFKSDVLTKADLIDLVSGKKRIGEFPVIYKPVGLPSQHAALAAIATLANKHDVLKEAAIQALASAATSNPPIKALAEKHLQRISKP
ncbi:MAG TPA: hypothetical protein VE135_17035 [Pyrinomonadaceae bacterium]|nr:hypothetical protein [Pyrinomonadaceae bacterium]